MLGKNDAVLSAAVEAGAHVGDPDASTDGDTAVEPRWTRRSLLAYAVITIGATVAVIGPSNLGQGNGFISWRGDGIPGPVAGDHIQLGYQLWLWHDAVTGGGHWPWIDPYLFGASGDVVANFGWPLVVVTLPVSLVAGPLAAYNTMVVLGFVLAAAAAAAWTSSLGVRPAAAGAAGLAYALAPIRIIQMAGHGTAHLAWMFPALLLCLELALRGNPHRARRWGFAAVAVLVSIALSGDYHHAVFAAVLTPAYVVLRLPRERMERIRLLLLPGIVGFVLTGGAALLLYETVIGRSSAREGRTMEEAAFYAPRWIDLFVSAGTHGERLVHVGRTIGLVALAGLLIAVVRNRQRWLALGLAGGWAVCAWFSIAPSFVNRPILQDTYRLIPFFSFSRVPGRLMMVGALLVAALVAGAVNQLGRTARMWLLVPFAALLLVDLPLPRVGVLDQGGKPYEGLAEDATILELPVYEPWHHGASPYSWYITRHPGPRLGGYFVIVPDRIDELRQQAAEIERHHIDDGCRWAELVSDAEIDLVSVHLDRFEKSSIGTLDHHSWGPQLDALRDLPGLDEIRTKDRVVVFEVTDPTFGCKESL